jgi:membrane protein implicated in regulation of membrane protease activity
MLETMAQVPYIAWLVQIPFYFLELLVGLVQALVFMLLTAVFTLLICRISITRKDPPRMSDSGEAQFPGLRGPNIEEGTENMLTGNLSRRSCGSGAALAVGLIGMKASEAVGRNPALPRRFSCNRFSPSRSRRPSSFYARCSSCSEDRRSTPAPGACAPATDEGAIMSVLALMLQQETGGGPVEKIRQTFGVDWPHLTAQFISFAIVCAALYWLAYQPVLRMLEARRQQIALGQANAEKINAALANIESQRQERDGGGAGAVGTAHRRGA